MADRRIEIIIAAKDTATKVIRQFGKGLDGALSAPRRAVAAVGQAFGNLKTAIVTAAASFGIFRGAASAIETAANYENIQLQLTGITGSAEAAAAKLAEIENAFRPAKVQAATDAYIKLRQFGLDPTTEQLQGLLDATAKAGGGLERLEGINLALGQAWAKQKLQGEEILQLVERGVPVWDLLAEATGKNVAELQELSSKGKLGRDTISALIDEMGRAAEGASDLAATGWEGMRQEFDALIQVIERTVVGGGVFDLLKSALADVNAVLEYLVGSGAVSRWADEFAAAATKAGTYADGLVKVFQGVTNGVRLAVNAFTAGVKGVGAVVAATLASIVEVSAQALDLVGSSEWAAAANRTAGALRAVSKEFSDAVSQDRKDIEAAFAGLGDAFSNTKSELATLVDEAREWKNAQAEASQEAKKTEQSTREIGKAAGEAAQNYKALSEEIKAAVTATDLIASVNQVSQAFADGAISSEEYASGLTMIREKTGELAGEQKQTATETEKTTEATQRHTAAAAEQTEVISGGLDVMGFMRKQLEALRAELSAISENALAIFNQKIDEFGARLASNIDVTRNMQLTLRDMGNSSAEFSAAIDLSKNKIEELTRILRSGQNEISRWTAQTALLAERIKVAALEQAESATYMIERLGDMETATASVVAQAEGMVNSYNLLDSTTLSNLRSEVDRITAANERLADSAEDALRRFQDLVDRQAGNELAIAERERAEAIQSLQDQLTEARRTGNVEAVRDLEQALILARQYHEEEIRVLKEKLEAEKAITDEREKQRMPGQDRPVQDTTYPYSPPSTITPAGGQTLFPEKIEANIPDDTILELGDRLFSAVDRVAKRPQQIVIDGQVIADIVTEHQERAATRSR